MLRGQVIIGLGGSERLPFWRFVSIVGSTQPVICYDLGGPRILFRVADLLAIVVIHQTVHQRLAVLVIVVRSQQLHRSFIEATQCIAKEIVTALRQVVDVRVKDALSLVEHLFLGHACRRVLVQVAIIARAATHALLGRQLTAILGCV